MNEKAIDKLEEKIEEDIKKLGLLPTQRTVHLMAKAAVTVYEAAVENGRPEE